MTRACAAALDEKTSAPEAPLCAACAGLWGEPIHGFMGQEPPATTHCYESVWFKERLAAGAVCSDGDLAILKGEAKPPPRKFILIMPSKKTAAQPPPPPSSPTYGALPAPPAVAAVAEPKKKRKAVAKTATPSRKRSPTARIADRSPPAVAIGVDFERTQQSVEMLRSLLHVFEPAVYEEDGEPLEIDDYEYVKLEKCGDSLVSPTGERFSYSVEKGVVAL